MPASGGPASCQKLFRHLRLQTGMTCRSARVRGEIPTQPRGKTNGTVKLRRCLANYADEK